MRSWVHRVPKEDLPTPPLFPSRQTQRPSDSRSDYFASGCCYCLPRSGYRYRQDDILSFNVPTFAEAEPEGCIQVRSGRGRGGDKADSIDLFRLLLRMRGEWRKNETDSENDREPDHPENPDTLPNLLNNDR